MRIRTKIVLPIIIAMAIILSFSTIYSYYYTAENLKTSIYKHLETTVQSRADHIKNFIREQENKTLIIATQQELTNEELKEIKSNNDEYIELFALDSFGKIIASSEESIIGIDKSKDEYFTEGRKGFYFKDIYLSETLHEEGFVASAPQGDENILVIRINPSFLNEIVLDKTGLGETGETYLVNKEGYAISPLLFTEDAVLKQKIDSINAKNCFSRTEHEDDPQIHVGHEAVETFLDYNDEKVIGTHVYIPEMEWCLLSEIGESEAMASIKDQLIFATISILIVFVILSITIYLIARRITKPITLLKEGTEIVGKGNLNYKVAIDSDDEIGALSKSFDEMTVAIKKSRAEVDQKVEDQTKEIRKNADQISKDKNKIETIINGIGDGVFVVDADLKIVLFNPVASRISGFSKKEALGKNYKDILRFVFESDTSKVNDKFIKNTLATGKPQSMHNHTLLITKKGKQISVADSAAPLTNEKGKIVGCVVVFRDATTEREIDRMKTEFVSVASHQLKTPLTGIKWMSELLLREKLDNKQREYALDVNTSASKLTKLVDNLLNVSHIETGRKFDIEKVDANVIKLIDSAIKLVEKNNKNKKISIVKSKETPSKLIINIDPDKIKQAIGNLIDNAIKYSKKGGTVEVSCFQNEDGVMLSVKDSGIGIPVEQQDRIFEKFFRADNVAQHETDGTGLGLYIVKAIIEAHGGKIRFESDENKGTTFYIKLPLK